MGTLKSLGTDHPWHLLWIASTCVLAMECLFDRAISSDGTSLLVVVHPTHHALWNRNHGFTGSHFGLPLRNSGYRLSVHPPIALDTGHAHVAIGCGRMAQSK